MSSQRSTNREALCHRLLVIGIPPHLIPQLVDVWTKWVTNNGPEWACKRFKSLKVDLIRQHDGQQCITPYVRKNRSGVYFGVIGALFRWAKASEKRFSRVLQALCIYTSEISPTETKSQLDKFLKAVSCDKPIGLSMEELTALSWTTKLCIGQRKIEKTDNSVLFYRGSPEKFAPLPHNLGVCSQDRKILQDLYWFMGNDKNLDHAIKYSSLYGPVIQGIGHATSKPPPELKYDSTSYAGEVHFIQEPGYKLRAVASPYRIHQLALKPLGQSLGRIVESLPWDCTFDQSKAIPLIRERLKLGSKIYSIDLSNATDFFPLRLQEIVLRSIFGDIPDINLFRDISQMKWKSKYGDIQWKRGQPLGLYPSFFAFTLTHGLLLKSLSTEDNEFLVVGDDVVIFTDSLYSKYIDILNKMCCPFSQDKSLSSNLFAEFTGKIITIDRVIPQLKWRKMSNDSFLDLAKLLGPRSRELMTRRQRDVFDSVRNLQPPIGLNMSIPGSDMLSSFIETERILSIIQHSAVRSLTGLIRTAWNNSMDDPSKRVLNPDTHTFDKKVLMVFQKTVFSHYMWLEHLSDLPQALGLEPRLPILASPSRISTLNRYEGFLRLIKQT